MQGPGAATNVRLTQQYPFIAAEIDDETYFCHETTLFERTGEGNLHHYS